MKPEQFSERLVKAGLSCDPSVVASLPGVGVRQRVIFHSAGMGAMKEQIAQMPNYKREALIKGLALYEDSIGGVGSPTPLHWLFELLEEPIDEVFDWVVNNTRSYDYYARGATSWQSILSARHGDSRRKTENLQKEHDRKKAAQARRAITASGNLYNAVRRGDKAAVAALLLKGASPNGSTPEGVPLSEYAASIGQIEISQLLRDAEQKRHAKDSKNV